MRESGILLHIASLNSDYGIGSMGRAAYKFAAGLKDIGCKVWQILPINPTSYGDSPYQSFCTFAGNIYLIDLDELVKDGFLRKKDLPDKYPDDGVIDYGKLYVERYATLQKAFDFSYEKNKAAVERFSAENTWLNDFALFMSLKERYDGASWQEFPKELKMRRKNALAKAREELKDRIAFYEFTQYLFSLQWKRLKAFVNSLGIKIMGDVPIYVAIDSSDVWSNPKTFRLDGELVPTEVAGVPPDYFCEDGQLWGNPIYDLDRLKKTGYGFWVERIRKATEYYDMIRLDHFIGFANYYSVPYGEKTAKNGKWNDGMGKRLFNALHKNLGDLEIIAEDLGVLSDKVIELRDSLKLPGMRVLQFTFDPNNDNYLMPKDVKEHTVIYTGTHDNDTTFGWYLALDEQSKAYVKKIIGFKEKLSETQEEEGKRVTKKLMDFCFSSNAYLAIVPVQDILCLDSSRRMNSPGIESGNWQFRLKKGELTANKLRSIKALNAKYNRN